MQNKICLITGGTSGIGKATALGLAEKGATVVIAGRDRTKCIKTVERIRKKTGNAQVDFLVADLSAKDEIKQLAAEFKKKYKNLHVLINNAGARFMDYHQSRDGYELTFALNHLAYFLLTLQLLDIMKDSAPARIINVASGNLAKSLDFDPLIEEAAYDGRKAYAQSKFANLLFTFELSTRLQGSGVTVNALNPGGVATRFNSNNGLAFWLRHLAAHLLAGNLVSPKIGALTNIYLALAPEAEGMTGKYFYQQKPVNKIYKEDYTEMAAKLWQMTETLI